MSAPDPRQFYTKISDVQQKFGGLTQTSQFMVQLGLSGSASFSGNPTVESHLYNSDVFDDNNRTDNFNFFCSEATLPGSTFDVMELSGSRQGIIERMPNRRVYTDFDLTFYVDNEYKILRLFEEWMNYIDPITGSDGIYQGNPKGQKGFADNNCYYRFRYPSSYKRPVIIHKFERNLLRGKTMNRRSGDVKKKKNVPILSYIFLEAFPLNIQAIPFSYEGTDVTKVSINFSYTRYIVNKNSGMGKSSADLLRDQSLLNSFNTPLFDQTFTDPNKYDLDLNIFGANNTVDFNFNTGLQSFSDRMRLDAFNLF